MKKKLLLLVTGLLCLSLVKAQDVVKWKFSAKKIADKTYELHLTPVVQEPWHIYSQRSPDGGALPTKITFAKHPLITLTGTPKEVGRVVSKYEEVFDVTVKYFDGPADFVQVVKLKGAVKTNLNGTIEFMACNDEQCLPPATVNFSISLQ